MWQPTMMQPTMVQPTMVQPTMMQPPMGQAPIVQPTGGLQQTAKGELPLVDGAKWGMPGIMVPKPDKRLTSKAGALDSEPKGVFHGYCGICQQQGHKAAFCPPGIYTVMDPRTQQQRRVASPRYMFQQGHFKVNGEDAKP